MLNRGLYVNQFEFTKANSSTDASTNFMKYVLGVWEDSHNVYKQWKLYANIQYEN